MEEEIDAAQEERIRQNLIGRSLDHLEVFIINEKFFVFDVEKRWVVDAGIGLLFGDTKLIFGWDTAKELFLYSSESLKQMLGDIEYFRLNEEEITGIRELIGGVVKDVSFKWSWYQECDEEGEVKSEKIFIPKDIHITFENGRTLHLAAMEFAISAIDQGITRARYNSQANLYIGVDHLLEII
ncbi:MAG: hypothetical protein SGI87_02095 [Flavobacteriales bacterium]|nr:hypothetical protein [Flavobacteriales bacterium]